MCGILGIVARPGRTPPLERSAVVRMRDVMTSRGPDDAGLFAERNVILGHRRLAIRDPEAGGQPWIADDGRTALVYNGEIYDVDPLRAELESLGHVFRTNCDTEVVAAACREWGREAAARLRGMFAFGFYDFRTDSLVLARDRCGVKPLFVAEVDDCLVFASSLPAILAHPRFTARPNLAAIGHYLTTLRITLRRQTMYEDVWQLLPGETFLWHDGDIDAQSYWTPPFPEVIDDGPPTFDEATAALDRDLREAINLRLVADVPAGVFTSGGVDSSTMAALLREDGASALPAFCGGGTTGDDRSDDDFTAAAACSAFAGFEHHAVRLDPGEYHDRWTQLVREYHTPVSTPSDVVIARLSEEARKSVGIVLGGEGADELLCGYEIPHWGAADFALSCELASGRWTGTPREAVLFRRGLERQYGRGEFGSEVEHYFALNSLIPAAAKPGLFRPEVRAAIDHDRVVFESYSRTFEDFAELDPSRRMQAVLYRVNLEALLSRLDTATMTASLEARVPFTDHVLTEQVLQLPHAYRISVAEDEPTPRLPSAMLAARGSLRSKRLLRAVARRVLPRRLADRPKQSFPTPIAHWLPGEWGEWSAHTLRTSGFARELFRPEAVEELAGNPAAAGMWLWPILNVSMWGDAQWGSRAAAA